MIKKTITYTDFNGVERTEVKYFNLTKTELTKMELGVKGGFTAMMQRIIDSQDNVELLRVFDEMIAKSYGVKSDDGKRFIKNPEVLADFVESGAYDALFMELLADSKAMADFFNGMIPADLAEEVAKQQAQGNFEVLPKTE